MCPLDLQAPLRREAELKADQTVNKSEIEAKSRKRQRQHTEQESCTNQLIEVLRAEVLEMKKIVLETVEANKKYQAEAAVTQIRRRLGGCRACQVAQASESCRHCYRCGQEGHLSRGCQQSREQQGNWRGLLSRDPQ